MTNCGLYSVEMYLFIYIFILRVPRKSLGLLSLCEVRCADDTPCLAEVHVHISALRFSEALFSALNVWCARICCEWKCP